MRTKRVRTLLVALLLGSLGFSMGGCPPDEYDWQWAVPSIIGAYFAGGASGSLSVTVERNCFENGVQVDCSRIPPR